MRTTIALILLVAVNISNGQEILEIDDSGAAHKLKNKPAPSFASLTLDSKKIELADFKNKIVLLNFGSLSCAACFKELPELNELVNKYPKDKFIIISLMDNSKEELLSKFDTIKGGYKMKKQIYGNDKIDFQIIPGAKEIMKLYTDQVEFPQTFLLNQSGTIAFYFPGYGPKRGVPGEITSRDLIMKEIDRLMSNSR